MPITRAIVYTIAESLNKHLPTGVYLACIDSALIMNPDAFFDSSQNEQAICSSACSQSRSTLEQDAIFDYKVTLYVQIANVVARKSISRGQAVFVCGARLYIFIIIIIIILYNTLNVLMVYQQPVLAARKN